MTDEGNTTPAQAEETPKPWWKRKKYNIPFGILILLVLAGIFGEPEEEDSEPVADEDESEEVAESTPTPTPTPVDDGEAADEAAEESDDGSQEDDEPADGDGDEQAAEDDDLHWRDLRGEFDASPDELRQRWNHAVQVVGAGFTLDEPIPPPNADSGFFGLPASEYQMGGWGKTEFVLTEDHSAIVEILITGQPSGAEQGTAIIGTMNAALAASTGLSPDESMRRMETDLAMSEDQIDAASHDEVAEIEGYDVEVSSFDGEWEFWIATGPN